MGLGFRRRLWSPSGAARAAVQLALHTPALCSQRRQCFSKVQKKHNWHCARAARNSRAEGRRDDEANSTVAACALVTVALLAASASTTVVSMLAYGLLVATELVASRRIWELTVVFGVPFDAVLGFLCAGFIWPKGDSEADLIEAARLAAALRSRLEEQKRGCGLCTNEHAQINVCLT